MKRHEEHRIVQPREIEKRDKEDVGSYVEPTTSKKPKSNTKLNIAIGVGLLIAVGLVLLFNL